MRQHICHGRIFQGGQFRLRQDRGRKHIHHNQKRQYPRKPQHGGLAHIGAPLGTGRVDACPLDANEYPDGNQHHAFDLREHAAQLGVALAPEVTGKHIHLECHPHQGDKGQQRHHLGNGGNQVDECCLLDAAQHQRMHAPQQNRSSENGRLGIALAKRRKEIAQGAKKQNQIAHVADPGADPITPGRRKPQIIAEARFGVGIHTIVQIRLAVGQCLKHEGKHQHANGSNAPTYQNGTGLCA